MRPLAACLCLFATAVRAAEPTGSEWEDCSRLSAGKEPPRAWSMSFPDVASALQVLPERSPRWMSLDSETEWRFSWCKRPRDRPVGFQRPGYDVSGWDVVKVPCSWQAMGIRASGERYGMPIHMDEDFIFTPPYPANSNCWPRVTGFDLPAEWWMDGESNPVGCYRRDFALPADWLEDDVYIQFDGVESFFYLWVNGSYVGFSKSSRDPAEFNVSRFVKAGANTVALEVYRNSDGSYLESTDIFRLSGILRSVSVHRLPKVHVRDVFFVTEPAEKGVYDGDWCVDFAAEVVNSNASEARVEASVEVFDASGRLVPYSGAGTWRLSVGAGGAASANGRLVFSRPLTWSAELPRLYTLVVELRGDGGLVEAVPFQLGFRQVEIRDAASQRDRVFLFNGRPVKLKGINRGECDPMYGHHVPDARLEEDIVLVKRGNFNHIRNSHMPQPGYFYYLCNKLGIYVMDEANLESHGYFYGEHSLSGKPEWREAHLDRVRNMVERNKNQPCVVIWSLGNEAGSGENFKACSDWVHARDRSRPDQYVNFNWCTDIGSRQYPSVGWMRACAAGDPSLRQEGRELRYPFHVNEYAHNLVNGAGNLMDFQAAIESSDRIMGGALWDFADQSLYAVNSKGVRYLAFGGDFGEKPTNGQGILNGWLTAERIPEPGYYEARHVFQEFTASLDAGGRSFTVRNKHFFRDASAYSCRVTSLCDGEPVSSATHDLDLPPRGTARLPVPDEALAAAAGGRLASVRVEFALKSAEGVLPSGWTVSRDQFELNDAPPAVRRAAAEGLASFDVADGMYVFSAGDSGFSFSRSTGELVSWRRASRELLAEPVALDCFRAPVGGDTFPRSKSQDMARRWMAEGLRRMQPVSAEVSDVRVVDGAREFTARVHYRGVRREACPGYCYSDGTIVDLGPAAETNASVFAASRWRVFADGSASVSTEFSQSGAPVELPRVGWRFVFREAEERVSWLGAGPWETYSDRRSGAVLGRWSLPLAEFQFPYGRNQDSGNREGTWRVDLGRAGVSVSSLAGPFAFMASPYSPTELIETVHYEELPPPSKSELGFYAKVRGLGSGNCGPLPLPRDRLLPDRAYSLSLLLSPAAR